MDCFDRNFDANTVCDQIRTNHHRIRKKFVTIFEKTPAMSHTHLNRAVRIVVVVVVVG